MIEGLGADTFVFDACDDTYRGDRIADFASGIDRIDISTQAFTELAKLGLGALDIGELTYTSKATTTDQHLFYDQASGTLYYDADGSGEGIRVQIAVFEDRPLIEPGDITLI